VPKSWVVERRAGPEGIPARPARLPPGRCWKMKLMSSTTNSSYDVGRSLIPADLIDAVLRLLHLDLLENGASAQTLADWLWSAHWFPHLNYRAAVVALADALPADWRTGTMSDPQIFLQFPHCGPQPEITFHVDQEPHWAHGRRYLRIVGVPLTPWRLENGGLLIKLDDETIAVEIDPGDAVLIKPDLPHSGGLNLTGSVRYGIYFRWLQDNPAAPAATAADGRADGGVG
jgi:hypothetical protein